MTKDIKTKAIPGVAPKTEKLKIPKTTGKCADLLYTLEKRKAELKKPFTVVEEQCKQLEQHLIDTLPADDVNGVIGELAKVVVNRQEVASAKDWMGIYTYIIAEGLTKYFDGSMKAPKTKAELLDAAAQIAEGCAFDLMKRGLSSPAVLARKAGGVVVPGTETLFVKKVSCTKR